MAQIDSRSSRLEGEIRTSDGARCGLTQKQATRPLQVLRPLLLLCLILVPFSEG
jgi:hypothetical protein